MSLKFKIKNSELTKGFTLIELLAVIVVFTIIGSIGAGILVNSLRTSNKTDAVTNVKNNGNYVIGQITKTLRDATSLQSPYPCVTPVQGTSITVRASDGNLVTLDCGATDSITHQTTIASNSAPMLDTTTTGVKLVSCTFTCSQQTASDYPLMDIIIGLTEQSTSAFSEKMASATPIVFSTSILLRNLAR